ncbi:MAG: pyridoxal phosphate-dependent aminotransferase [Kiritimatiellae bacterium]|nr:pyridoxal phosphate-dependent aminotransferase [Kiritimatiellia bacterium]
MDKSRISENVAAITPSLTLGITKRVKSMMAAGRPVFGLAAGEPDFDTPTHIKEAAVAALNAGQTKYCPETGVQELREAIAEKFQRENGLSYQAEQIVISNGAKQTLFNLVLCLCRPGDEVIIPSPYWLSYPEMVRVAGGRSVFVKGRRENNYKVSADEIEAAITERSRVLILNSPSNPSGTVYTKRELADIADVAVRHGLTIISDEVYEKLVYDGAEHVSVAALSRKAFEHTATVNGFSKTYAMTGWRLGYCAAPLELAKAVAALQSHSTSGPNTFAQYGAIAALRSSQECVVRMVSAFAERRRVLLERLGAIPRVSCIRPMGAFYVFADISAFGLDSVTFAERLLEEAGVAVIPGVVFGEDKCVRLSYACGLATIEAAMDRFEKFVGSL